MLREKVPVRTYWWHVPHQTIEHADSLKVVKLIDLPRHPQRAAKTSPESKKFAFRLGCRLEKQRRTSQDFLCKICKPSTVACLANIKVRSLMHARKVEYKTLEKTIETEASSMKTEELKVALQLEKGIQPLQFARWRQSDFDATGTELAITINIL